MTNKPILCLDFDGVVHSYTSRWQGADKVTDPPTEGAIDAIAQYLTHFDVQIFSSRSHQHGGIFAMQKWLWSHMNQAAPPFDPDLIGYPQVKPPALVTLDDRALTFVGSWPSVAELKAFRPWNKR